MNHHRLIVITGYGRQSGKTTIACRLIKMLGPAGVTAVKISPHFHEPQAHLLPLPISSRHYRIWQEMSGDTEKDSSRYLQAGASASYYIQTEENHAHKAFRRLMEKIPAQSAIVCESPSLAARITPDLLIVAPERKDVTTTAKTITIPLGVRTIYIKPWINGTEPEIDLPPEFLNP